jgi:hypothetical protein
VDFACLTYRFAIHGDSVTYVTHIRVLRHRQCACEVRICSLDRSAIRRSFCYANCLWVCDHARLQERRGKALAGKTRAICFPLT